MVNHEKFLIVLSFLFFCVTSFGQFESFNENLSSNKISASIVDSYGLLWIATEEGLNMYDGIKVHKFESILSDENTILNSNVDRIRELKNGDLLFTSKDGISLFQRNTFDFRRIKIPRPVSLLVDDKSQEIFITTSLNGIFILDYNYGIKKNYLSDPLNPFSISSNSFRRAGAQKTAKVLNNSGDVIFGTDKGINIYQSKSKKFQRFIAEFSNDSGNEISVLSKLDNNLVLIGTNSGLKIFDYDTKKFKDIDDSKGVFSENSILDAISFKLNNNIIDEFGDLSADTKSNLLFRSFVLTNDGFYKLSIDGDLSFSSSEILFDNSRLGLENISVSNNGFYVWGNDKNEIISYNNSGNLISKLNSSQGLSNLCINEKEELFVSTLNGLFTSIEKPKFVKYKGLFAGLENYENHPGFILRFYKWSDENNWVTIDHKTLRISNNGNNTEIELNKIIDEKFINNLTSNHIKINNEKLYFFDQHYLTVFNINNLTKKKYKTPYNFKVSRVKVIDNNVFFSYSNGIIVFAEGNGRFDFFEYDDLFNKNFPRGFSDIEKVAGQYWVSNYESGLHIFKGNLNSNAELFSSDTLNPKKIPSFSINELHHDSKKGATLISTQGDGLFIHSLKDSIFKQFTYRDGLLSNNIIDSKYGDDFIWILTSKGINFFNNNNKFIYEIDQSNGFKGVSFDDDPLRIVKSKTDNDNYQDDDIYGNFIDDNNETIDIVGSDYIITFNTNDIVDDNDSFNIELLNMRIFNFSQDYFSDTLVNGTLDIDSSTDFIELEVFTNNKFKRNQVEYFYSSNTTNGSFVSNGNNNVVRIQSIPNYKSEVKVKAVNKSGIESSNIISFNISKTPPWYQRTESVVAYVFILLISIFLYSKWREKSTFKKLEEGRRNKELEEARKLQNSLLPKKIPTRKEYDISVYLKSASEVGGDYYDFIENENKDLYAICGDATGHGVVSGIMVSVTKAGLNGIQMADPSTILNNLNSIVKRVNFGRLRMSLSVAKINNGSIELSSAAMPPTYYYSAKNKSVEEILVPNLPLGGIEGEKFDGVKKDFKKGDVVVMISDGLPELPNKEDILLDYPKVLKCIENNCNESADGIKDALVRMSDKWADGLMNPDDITIVVIKKAS